MSYRQANVDYPTFLERVIAAGLASIKTHGSITRHTPRLEGSRAGFEACRGKMPSELGMLLELARRTRESIRRNGADDAEMYRYWWTRYYELQVEHVCNTVSARQWAMGLSTIIPPTERGLENARLALLGKAEW